MSAFELNGNPIISPCDETLEARRLKEECIVALKVYDSVRNQDCLRGEELGPARAAECVHIGDEVINEGEVITPPSNAASVTIDKLKVKKVIIVEKKPSPFKNGFWDIDLKYVFEYRLTFREADGEIIGSVKANSIFNKMVVLFGSHGTDLVISTDLFCGDIDSTTIDAEPFVLVESKAIGLNAELRFQRRRPHHVEGDNFRREPNVVIVTIGLFTIIKVFRIVNLTVQSRGFCIPPEGGEVSPLNPCEFFDSLDFPMDSFAPPQKPEFFAGISGDIPRSVRAIERERHEREHEKDHEKKCCKGKERNDRGI